MKTWLLDRALLILSAVGFVAAILVSSQWLGNENLYSAITAITIVALWFKVARLTKLLREHGIDPSETSEKQVTAPMYRLARASCNTPCFTCCTASHISTDGTRR